MPTPRYLLSDFVEIQRKSFFDLLEKGLIEEFSKLNPIRNSKKNLEFFFYPEYYKLTRPIYTPKTAILNGKSYTSKLYIPVQLIDKLSKTIKLKWVCIGNLPLMTKRGHFILNGAPRVIVNQILRSPGIYYQQKIYENFKTKWSSQPDTIYKRYYADLICQRGTWLRLEIDKDKFLWAQMKKGPKIPIFWFLIAMGLTEKMIFNTLLEPNRLLGNIEKVDPNKPDQMIYKYVKNPPDAWAELYNLITNGVSYNNSKTFTSGKVRVDTKSPEIEKRPPRKGSALRPVKKKSSSVNLNNSVSDSILYASPLSSVGLVQPQESIKKLMHPSPCFPPPLGGAVMASHAKSSKTFPENNFRGSGIPLSPPLMNQPINLSIVSKPQIFPGLLRQTLKSQSFPEGLSNASPSTAPVERTSLSPLSEAELGRKWLFNKFMNSRTYDLGKLGRFNFNKKLGISISPNHCTLTAQDLLYATNNLLKVEKGFKKIDDIDHLKNRRVRTSGELLQIQIATGLVRLEKTIREKMNFTESTMLTFDRRPTSLASWEMAKSLLRAPSVKRSKPKGGRGPVSPSAAFGEAKPQESINKVMHHSLPKSSSSINEFINTKPFNGALREFFGSSPLSQFMDQINPLSELTHKRRLSSMGPGGVTRDTATLAIRGIHPTHYGRICPVETPEGKNTGLVNSITAFARINSQGFLLSPFYKVYKGQVQKNAGMFYLSAEQEEKTKLAASDLFISVAGFLPKSNIPVRIAEEFTKIPRESIEYIGVSPIQMISIATSLIPFLEHDDANRALMGSNMQRQAVPLVRPERPIVGTGLESRAVSDSGHVIQSKYSGFVRYVSSNKIIVYSF